MSDAATLYADLLIRCIANTVYGDDSQEPWSKDPTYRPERRQEGRDWPSIAHSMAGVKRLQNIRELTEAIIAEDVPGDLIETGVWRGGACILMRGLLAARGIRDRQVLLADSFEGLPPPDPALYPADLGDRHHTYTQMAVSIEEVKANFSAYGLLDEQVEFVKGWFKDTLPTLRDRRYALLRLDGDMYQSTMDSLTNLYDRLSPGGFVIIDDYGAVKACRAATDEFRSTNDVRAPLTWVDWTGVWWRKPFG